MVPALLAVAIEYSEIASVTPSHKASGRNLECRWTFFINNYDNKWNTECLYIPGTSKMLYMVP